LEKIRGGLKDHPGLPKERRYRVFLRRPLGKEYALMDHPIE
jgi:hypothetical protein